MLFNTSIKYFFHFTHSYNKKYLIFAMQDGKIRVNKVNPKDYMDLQDYWEISMHDNINGFVPRMCFSYNERYFFSCGYDGNIFSYQFFPEKGDYVKNIPKRTKVCKPEDFPIVEDVTDYKTLSLEETIVKAEYDRIMSVANRHKEELREELRNLGKAYLTCLERNEKLLPTQMLPRSFFNLDKRIANNLKETCNAKLALEKRKIEFKVEKSKVLMNKMKKYFIDPLDVFPICVKGIKKSVSVKTMRQRELGNVFYEMREYVEAKLIEDLLKGRYIHFFFTNSCSIFFKEFVFAFLY